MEVRNLIVNTSASEGQYDGWERGVFEKLV